MVALNKLKAAPGQQNRGLIRAYLAMKKWIRHDGEVEEWPVANIPVKPMDWLALAEEVDRFEVSQRESGVVQ